MHVLLVEIFISLSYEPFTHVNVWISVLHDGRYLPLLKECYPTSSLPSFLFICQNSPPHSCNFLSTPKFSILNLNKGWCELSDPNTIHNKFISTDMITLYIIHFSLLTLMKINKLFTDYHLITTLPSKVLYFSP